jgi:peroxiredoxin
MNKLFSIVLAILMIFALNSPITAAPLKVGDMAIDVQIQDLEGNPVQLMSYLAKEKNNLLVFFNTACGICIRELQDLKRHHDKSGKANIVAIGIDIAGAPQVRRFNDKMKLPYPVLVDPEFKVGTLFGLGYTPASVILDKEMKVVRVIGGYRPSEKAFVDELF